MTSIGIRAGDALSLFKRLERDLPELARIPRDFPDLAYSLDMLSNALVRDYPDQQRGGFAQMTCPFTDQPFELHAKWCGTLHGTII